MASVADKIKEALEYPFAGAIFYLRHIDPLWQSEIGEPREWQVKMEKDTCGCDCPYCEPDQKTVFVFACSAAQAVTDAENETSWVAVGVRVKGSNGPYADAFDVAEAARQ